VSRQSAAQVDGVERYITLEPRARVLDLSCGGGRQTLELARRGYRVLGVDCDEGPLAEARAAARQERLNVHFLHTDIRQISYRNEFDAVVNLHSSIGCLPNDRDHLRVLEGVRKGLKSGGRLLLDMINREWVIRHGEPGSFDLEAGRLAAHAPGVAGLRVYAFTEFKALLERAGLELLKVWGGYEGEAYGLDSPRMVVLARRAAEAPPRRPKDAHLVSAIRIKGRRR
jgi:SAM-dependent methyltransferase